MSQVFDTLFLLALPASGKSEVRTFLAARDPARFRVGPNVQLDDYPYVHLQLRVDEELEKLGQPRLYHHPDPECRNGPFKDAAGLGALVRLLNEDYAELVGGKAERPEHAARRLMERFDAASEAAGSTVRIGALDASVRASLEEALEPEAREFFDSKADACPPSLDGHTVVIEFARGGPEGDEWPLPPAYGYAGTMSHLSPELLERSAILYVWVEPEESRRKNRARARPDGHGSILFHGTPETVMRQEYGRDDMGYLLERSKVPGTIEVTSHGRLFHLPVARFDNRVDRTTFVHGASEDWPADRIEALDGALSAAFEELWGSYCTVWEA